MTNECEFKLYLPLYCVLKPPIRECLHICDAAKIYFGELCVLASKTSFVKATDEQLAEMKGVDIRTIKRWNQELEQQGFIERETSSHLVENPKESKCLWTKKRKIFINENPNSNKDYERDKNVPIPERDKFVPIDEGDKNVPILKQELKLEKKQQQQQQDPPKPEASKPESQFFAAAVLSDQKEQQQQKQQQVQKFAEVPIFDCLKDLDIPLEEKEWITRTYIQFPDDVSHAVAYIQHPDTVITTTPLQALKWACKAKPKLPISKENYSQENKAWSKKLAAHASTLNIIDRFTAGNSYIEIDSGGQSIPFALEYSDKSFQNKVAEQLKKIKFKV